MRWHDDGDEFHLSSLLSMLRNQLKALNNFQSPCYSKLYMLCVVTIHSVFIFPFCHVELMILRLHTTHVFPQWPWWLTLPVMSMLFARYSEASNISRKFIGHWHYQCNCFHVQVKSPKPLLLLPCWLKFHDANITVVCVSTTRLHSITKSYMKFEIQCILSSKDVS